MTSSEPVLTCVTALLAQGPGYPTGDTEQRLEIVLGLTPDARIDPDAYAADPRPWTTRRVRPGRADWDGELVFEDESWILRGGPDEDRPREDAPIWGLEVRSFHPGDYVTLRRPDGEELVFRVVSVLPADSQPD